MPLGLKGRRRLWMLAILGVALLSLATWVHRQMRPETLTPIVLKRIGDAQGLQLQVQGEPSYALRPEPRLLLPNLQVRAQGSDAPWLYAEHAEISLPWDTLTGGEPIITRVELHQPVLDVPGMFAWIDSRPSTDEPLPIPTITDGVSIRQGVVRDKEWTFEGLNLDLPALQADQATTLSADATLVLGEKSRHPLDVELNTTPRADGKTLVLADSDVQLISQSPIPNLHLRGEWRLGRQLRFEQRGELRNWPKDWPALPAPLNSKQPPFPLVLGYDGKNDFSDVLSLDLGIPEHPVRAKLRVPAFQTWLSDPRSPLPPIDADYATKELRFDGVILRDVEIEIDDESVAPAR